MAAAVPEPRRFSANRALSIQSSAATSAPKRFVRQQVPQEILDDPSLKAAMAVLPRNYNFEIHKTIWRLKQAKAKRVALQFPEGLLLFACAIADILETFAELQFCIILGDVTYGACCVDDLSARALRSDFLVHYGHSCLVPVDQTSIPCLYVFVDIGIDVPHLVATVRHNFKSQSHLVLAGTIQFAAAVQVARAELASSFPSLTVPQAKPLSPGEVLGCTAPVIKEGSADAIVFVADGRFHLEAIMIANPSIPAFRYDPYSRVLTKEEYDQVGMRSARRRAIEMAQQTMNHSPGFSTQQTNPDPGTASNQSLALHIETNSAPPSLWGVVLGTLGRQGNPRVLEHVQARLASRGVQHTVFLVSELSPAKVALLQGSVVAWVQIACPRLSIDWGEAFCAPLLTPYEAEVALGFVPPWWERKVSRLAPEPCLKPVAKAQNNDGKAARCHCGESLRGVEGKEGRAQCRHGDENDNGMEPGTNELDVTSVPRNGSSSIEQEGGLTGLVLATEDLKVSFVPWNGNRLTEQEQVAVTEVGFQSSENGDTLKANEEVTGGSQTGQEEVSVGAYPMDYYAREGGPWNSVYTLQKPSRLPGMAGRATGGTS